MLCYRNRFIVAIAALLVLLISSAANAEGERIAIVKEGGALLIDESGEQIMSIPRFEEVTILGWGEEKSHISYGKEKGYIKTQYLGNNGYVTTFETGLLGKVNADDVNLRVKPDGEAQIASVLKKGTEVSVAQRYNSWYKIKCGAATGYVSSQYVDADMLKIDKSYSTLKMGSTGAEVVKLQRTLQQLGFYNGELNGTFGARTREAVNKYQTARNLCVDGVAGFETQAVLYKEQPDDNQ